MPDYEDLAQSQDPEQFPLNRVAIKLKQMPLKFLSNTPTDWFVLDKKLGEFWLKESMLPFWRDDSFRDLVRDRVEFGLNRYFEKKRNKIRGAEEAQGD